MTTDVFNEHLGVIQALRDNYARSEDAAAVATLVKTQQELSAACSQREKHVKETIKQLTGRVHKIEKEAAYPAPDDAHEQQVAQLSAATQEAQENVASLNGQLQALQQQRQDVKAKVVKLQQTADHIEQIVTEAEPRTRHQLSLYAHVSKITWQFEQRDRVAGTVSDPLRVFDFDPATTSSFDITNALWDLMGTED